MILKINSTRGHTGSLLVNKNRDPREPICANKCYRVGPYWVFKLLCQARVKDTCDPGNVINVICCLYLKIKVE